MLLVELHNISKCRMIYKTVSFEYFDQLAQNFGIILLGFSGGSLE